MQSEIRILKNRIRQLLSRVGELERRLGLGNFVVTKTYDWTGAVTAQNVWAPESGKKFVVTDMTINASAACIVTLFDNTDSTAYRILKASFAQYGGLTANYSQPITSADANNVLKITTSAGSGYVTVSGYEV